MKKFMVRILCCFVPGRNNRHKIREYFLATKPQIEFFTKNDLNERITNLQTNITNLKNELCDMIYHDVHRLIATAELHKQTFAGFRNKFAGKTVVLVGAGPSLNKFKPIKNAIYVGLNRAFLCDKIKKFDYLFSIDKAGIDQIYDKFIEYDCVKFVGDQNLGPMFQIPESVVNKIPNVRRYKTDAGFTSRFALDIEYMPLGNFNTVSLQAMQFILYTNPAKIYLVGIDCSSAGHFTDNTKHKLKPVDLAARGENLEHLASNAVVFWKMLKEFADMHYPDTEIISVNPVGLRGLFTDLDQEE